eukprot:3827460-Amphidinium_carterae.1
MATFLVCSGRGSDEHASNLQSVQSPSRFWKTPSWAHCTTGSLPQGLQASGWQTTAHSQESHGSADPIES